MSLKIGNIELKNNLVLAPMAGVTDLIFRTLCKEQGCGLVYTEMVSAKAIFYDNKNTKPLMEINPTEHPVSLQLFGSEPELMGDMAKKIEAQPFDILDINMGCPVPKVVNNNEGSALMKDPVLAGKIIESVVRSIKKPVTVKFRKGFDMNSVNAVEMARVAQESGASAVAVHGRTRSQYYSGEADWDIIREVKAAVHIPVIGNGDVFHADDADRMIAYTGCDGVMIGRGIEGNPWLFANILHYRKTGEILEKPDIYTVTDMIRRHTKMQMAYKGDDLGIREMRKHIGWYTTGYPGSSALRRQVNQVSSYDQLCQLLDEYLAAYGDNRDQ